MVVFGIISTINALYLQGENGLLKREFLNAWQRVAIMMVER